MTASKKWSPERKLKEAARREAKKEQARVEKEADALGPLYASQVEPARPVDLMALKAKRQMGLSWQVECTEKLFNPATKWLDHNVYLSLVVIARRHLPDDVVDRLDRRCRETYPSVSYWSQFWRDVLSGHHRVPFTYRRTFDPSKVTQYNPEGVVVVKEDYLPPDGFIAPYDDAWRKSYFWFLCSQCRRWHAPGQSECYDSGDVPLDEFPLSFGQTQR